MKGSRQKRASAVLAETAGALFSGKSPFSRMDPVKREKQERVSKNVNGVHIYNFTRLFPFVNPAFGNLHLFKPTFFSFSLSFAFMEK
ncbi:hypothetical protein ODJ80_11105 [Acutalibacter sp. LFL-21]|uniref:hypothetical protein n=1 Tax=Acutalibacter sp. LFL-21 TaxID=2983399 RepID=UPI0021D673AF|nr:hypothetical protein [Acutalibacter sp. LFL-21]MCU7653346.1 hypothetical protein [Acutalibacter sp. LFL-21]